MGSPKLLLDWHGEALVRWVARLALSAGCSPIIVITGAGEENIHKALQGLPVHYAHNPDWESGQSTSVMAGIKALPANVDAVIVFLGDQPQIPLSVAQHLLRVYNDNPRESILIPSYNEKRANPVLLARSIFEELTNLEGDAGARTIFSRHPVRLIPFDNPELLLDVDLPADYQALMEMPMPDYAK